MKKREGNATYFFLLFTGIVLALVGVDVVRHLTAGSASGTPPHSHVSWEQLAILGFCALLYLAERLRLFELSLRLYLLSLCLVLAKILFEVHTGRWESGGLLNIALFLLLVPLLITFARYPLRAIRTEARRGTS